MILLCKLINSFSACMKLLLWSKYHVGSGDLVMNHHTGNPSTGKRQSSQVWWVLSNGCPLHYCPRGAGNQTVLRTCEWLRFEGEGRQPRCLSGVFLVSRDWSYTDLGGVFLLLCPVHLGSH